MHRCELISNSDTGNKLTYTWFLKDFNYAYSQDLTIWESSVFEHSLYQHSWLLRCAAHRRVSNLSLYLKLVSSSSYEVKANLKLSVLYPVSEKSIMTRESEFLFTEGKFCGFERFADTNAIRDQVFENKLMVKCELTISTDTKPFQMAECKMNEDFGNLFESKTFSDVTLAVGGHEIKAHKAILSARSVVFAAMFKHEMMESKLDLVEVKDMDYVVLKEMLHFIYTGNSPNLHKMAPELLAASDKYDLERLKSMCEKQLCEDLSIETAAESLILADRHSANQLKFETIDFINSHAENVMKTEGWNNLIKTHSKLIAEVFQKFVAKQISKTGSQQII